MVAGSWDTFPFSEQNKKDKGDDTMRGLILEKRADEIMKKIYTAYGTDTGVLFGIPKERKIAVRAIIEMVLEEVGK